MDKRKKRIRSFLFTPSFLGLQKFFHPGKKICRSLCFPPVTTQAYFDSVFFLFGHRKVLFLFCFTWHTDAWLPANIGVRVGDSVVVVGALGNRGFVECVERGALGLGGGLSLRRGEKGQGGHEDEEGDTGHFFFWVVVFRRVRSRDVCGMPGGERGEE